jgi:hypothetical protein
MCEDMQTMKPDSPLHLRMSLPPNLNNFRAIQPYLRAPHASVSACPPSASSTLATVTTSTRDITSDPSDPSDLGRALRQHVQRVIDMIKRSGAMIQWSLDASCPSSSSMQRSQEGIMDLAQPLLDAMGIAVPPSPSHATATATTINTTPHNRLPIPPRCPHGAAIHAGSLHQHAQHTQHNEHHQQ